MDKIIYGNLGGVYFKTFSLKDNVLYFDYCDLKLNKVVNPHLKSMKLTEFAQCVGYMNKCILGISNSNLINLERNLLHHNAYGNPTDMYRDTRIISVSASDEYCLGVSLEKGDDKNHDFMVVYKIFNDSLPELNSPCEHDQLTIYKSYKDGRINVIYFTREETLSILGNSRLYLAGL